MLEDFKKVIGIPSGSGIVPGYDGGEGLGLYPAFPWEARKMPTGMLLNYLALSEDRVKEAFCKVFSDFGVKNFDAEKYVREWEIC